MGATININPRSNVKQNTAADLINSQFLQPVVARYEATSTASQTIINLPYLVDQANTDAFELYIDGRLLRSGALNDYTFTSIDGTNSSSQITLTGPIASSLNIIAIKRGLKREVEFATDSRFTQNYDLMTAGFQGFVDERALLSAVNGAPGAGQFRTFGIVGRASIPDLANDLRARMGIDRVLVQQIFEIQNEFGPNGERVFGALNDSRNLIRYVGGWNRLVDLYGPYSQATTTTDYIEIVFYGTGLNANMFLISSNDARITVDGGAESTNILSATYSTALGSRGYSANQVVPIVSGLSAGLHTVKIRSANAIGLAVYGFEILNESANVSVRPGTAYQNGKKLTMSAASSVSYNSGFETVTREGAAVAFSSTRGARVVEYLKSDGTKGKSAYLANAAQANLNSADHTYEEIVRVHYPIEFGANRADDFSQLFNTSDKAFALEDDTTTLVGSNAAFLNSASPNPRPILYSNGTNSFHTITFVGTGLDIMRADVSGGATLDDATVTVNGSSIGTITGTASTTSRIQKIVSGLPYGTHTVKINRDVNVNYGLGVEHFIIYGPKKPSIPSGSVEIADYNVMATFVANATAGENNISTGILRKSCTREHTYVGAGWSIIQTTNRVGGFHAVNSTAGNYLEYSFFGTGFDLRFDGQGTATNTSITVDSASDLSGFTTSFYGSGLTFTASTGVAAFGGGSGTNCGVVVNGLAMGLHKLRLTVNSGNLSFHAVDVITPIHSSISNKSLDIQNTLSVGSCAISDSRLLSPVKSESPKRNASQAFGAVSSPTTTSTTYVPMPDMSLVVQSSGGQLEISYNVCTNNTSAGGTINAQIYLDGVAVGTDKTMHAAIANAGVILSDKIIIPVSKGAHKVDIFWACLNGGTAVATSTKRNLTVREV